MPFYSNPIDVRASDGVCATNDGVTTNNLRQPIFAVNIKNGFNDPDFRMKIARGQDASHPYEASFHTVKRPIHHGEYYQLFNGVKYLKSAYGYCSGSSIPIIGAPSMASIDDIALKRLKGKLARDVNSFKALIPLAEIKETRNLISSTAKATEGLLLSLIDLKRGKLKDVARRASTAWLQFGFAVSPTINDIEQLASTISSQILRTDMSSHYYGNAETSWNSTLGTPGSATFCQGSSLTYGASGAFHTYRCKYASSIELLLRSSNDYSNAKNFGFSFGELPSLAWEVIPFSWVADYFSTVGPYLDDLFSSNSGVTKYLTKTVKYTCKQSHVQYVQDTNPTLIKLISKSDPGVSTYDYAYMNRSVLSALPHRELRFKTSDEIGKNSLNKLFNLSAILVR